MKIRLTRAGGQFGGDTSVEIVDDAAACREGTTERLVSLPDDLQRRLRDAARRVLRSAHPVAERLGPAVDGSRTRLDIEERAQRATIEMSSADEPSPELWDLLDLIDVAVPPDGPDGLGQTRSV